MTFIKRITMVIAPFMVLFLFSFKSSAEAAPQLTQTTFEVIEGGMQDALSSGSQFYGISPYTDGIIATYQIMGELYMQYMNSNEDSVALWTCDSDDVVVESLSSSDTTYLSSITLVDRLGHSVDPSTCYRVNYDNGYFHGVCYIDQYGDLVYDKPSLDDPKRKLGNIAFGGNLVDWDDFNNFYEFISDTAAANQMNVLITDENVDFSDLSYFLHFGVYQSWYSTLIRQDCFVFVPNICDFGNITLMYSNGGDGPDSIYQYKVLFNDDANWTCEYHNYGQVAAPNNIYVWSNFSGQSYDNYSYSHMRHFSFPWDPNNTTIHTDLSLSQFASLNYSDPSMAYYLFGYKCPPYSVYDDLVGKGLRPRPFRPVEPNEEEEPDFEYPQKIPEELIDLSDLEEFNYDPTEEPSPNPDFDPDEEISPDNYPEINPLPTPIPQPSRIPVKGTTPGPDPDPDPVPEIVIEETPDPMPAEGGDGFSKIPFFTNLQYRFPFSVPFDLHHAIQMLITTPEPPAWDFYWDITVAGETYSYHCVGDLSDFNELARLLRLLFLISALVGLAVITYKMYF